MVKSSKKSAPASSKKKGAMEMAKAAADNVKKSADKPKGKRLREPESDDELAKRKKK